MKNKIFLFATALFCTLKLNAQEQNATTSDEKSVYLKANAVFLPVGVLNVAVEKQISKKYTLQADILASPWKSFAGHELQYYSASIEGRYYFNEAFKHWFIGGNFAVSAFKMQKWNYWNDDNYWDKDNNRTTEFINSNLYQKGFSFILGVTGGYQFNIAENWNMEIYAGIGNSQDFYKGYDKASGKRYDNAKEWNKSGEWMPYRGGIMISYKIK